MSGSRHSPLSREASIPLAPAGAACCSTSPRHGGREAISLSVSTVTLLAELLAYELDSRRLERPRWVTAERVAEHLGVEREWVYGHAAELGAVRLGSGARGRLRFRLDLVDERLLTQPRCLEDTASPRRRTSADELKRQRRSRPDSGSAVQLLPIRGAKSATSPRSTTAKRERR
jgi:hypothetical protein